MANKKISELPAGAAVSDFDKFPAVESGSSVTVYKTAQQLKTFIGAVTASSIATSGGIASNTTFLRGDNTWATPPGTGGGGGGTGGAVVSGNAATFDTLADLQAATVQTGVNTVRTMGYYNIGDLGGAAYRRKGGGETDYELDRTSNGGTVKWELIPERFEIWLNQAGVQSPTAFNHQDNDTYPAHRAIDKFAAAKGLSGFTLRLDGNFYYSSKAWHFRRVPTKVIGTHNGSASGNGTTLRFPIDQSGLITNYQWGFGTDYMMALGNWTFTTRATDNTISPFKPPVGVCVWAGAGGGVPDGSCYRIVGGGTSPSNGPAGITSVTPGVDITWGTVTLRYDGNLITDPVAGGGTMDYYVGAETPPHAGGCVFENLELWGYFDGGVNPNSWNWKNNNAGIVMRIRGQISNCFSIGFAGHGFAIVADGDSDLGGPGNVNGTYVEHCSAYWNGKDGFHTGYSNSNASTFISIDVSGNGRWGVAEWCFLGSSWTGVQSAIDGRGFTRLRQYYPQCQYQGWIYVARVPILGSDSGWPAYINENPTTTPAAWIKAYPTAHADLVNAEQVITGTIAGTAQINLGAAVSGKQTFTAAGVASGDQVWYRITDGANWEIGCAGFAPGTPDVLQRGPKPRAGDPGGTIASSQPLGADGIYPYFALTNAATVKALSVAENYGDIAAWQPEIRFEPTGCFSTNNSNARNVFQYIYIEGGTPPAQFCWPTVILGGELNQSVDQSRGVIALDDGSWTVLSTKAQARMPDNSMATQFVTLNGGNILSWFSFNGQSWAIRGTAVNQNDIILENQTIGPGQYNPVWRVRSWGSSALYGRSGDGDWSGGNAPLQVTNLIVGDGTGSGGRLVQMGPGAPTGGYHAKGEFVLNDGTGSDNTTFLWRCTVAGTPGTWVART